MLSKSIYYLKKCMNYCFKYTLKTVICYTIGTCPCNQPLHLRIGSHQNYIIDSTLFENYSFLVAYINFIIGYVLIS